MAGGHGRPDPDAPSAAEQAEAEVDLWRQIVGAGFKLMRIPTPFQVGRVNCWLIEDEPLTLIDAGPSSGKSLDELARQLDALGYAFGDLEQIIVSHQHIDHLGLVDVVRRRSGAEVVAIEELVPFIDDYNGQAELDDRFAVELMLRHGISEEVVVALRSVSGGFRSYGAPSTVDRVIRDGETLEFRDRSLQVQLRPGHSPTDTLFWDEERRIMVGGDHLIKHISSNPLLSRRLDGSAGRTASLLSYIESLSATRELPAEIVLSGHGEPVTEHRELIDSRFRMHGRRAEKLLGLIGDEPMTAHGLAQELWGDVAVTQAFLTLSEVIGHMDLLIAEGRAVEVEDGEVTRFAAVTGAATAGNPSAREG
jgi:glyoxylase-like metal-dependent hydrolase (beta-lactamase superfamily II)